MCHILGFGQYVIFGPQFHVSLFPPKGLKKSSYCRGLKTVPNVVNIAAVSDASTKLKMIEVLVITQAYTLP